MEESNILRKGLIPISEHPLQTDQKYSESMKKVEESFYRECEKDGNCLYNAISLQIFPMLKVDEFKRHFFSFSKSFDQIDISSIVYETYVENIEETTQTQQIEDLNTLNLIGYLRLICSTYAILNSSKYEAFIDQENKSMKEYCNKNIDPMYQRGGDLEISVLAEALKLKITVISVLENECMKVSFGEGKEIKILHTPDHFEPLYD